MKKIILIAAAILAGSTAINAQTLYDANNLMQSELNGTARFVSMGGAMGALGGDISTTYTNPAGIGMFRSNDVMVTFGLNNTNVKSEFQKYSDSKDKTRATFDNIGIVFANRNDGSSLKFLNFAVNYRRGKSFNRNMLMEGDFSNSLSEQIANMTNSNGLDISPAAMQASDAYFDNSNYCLPWLGVLAFNAYLMNPVDKSGNIVYLNTLKDANGNVLHSENSADFYAYAPAFLGGTNAATYNSRERGGVDNVDFNVAFNFNDRFYLGATLGAYSINYKKESAYTEQFWDTNTSSTQDVGHYTLNNWYKMTGDGVDFKLGMIVRPSESSPFRIGLAVHTPTWYRLTENQIAYLDYDLWSNDDAQYKSGTSCPYDENGNDMESETKYRIETPWKFDISMATTVGNYAALDAEYEYADYSSAKMKYDNGDKMIDDTNNINNMMKSVHTLRLGAEFKPMPELAIRLGYNFVSPSMKDDAVKILANNAVRTDAEYTNTKAINNFTAGVGIRLGSFYWDMAYVYTHRTGEFYPFNPKNGSQVLSKADITDDSNHVMFTLGYRF